MRILLPREIHLWSRKHKIRRNRRLVILCIFIDYLNALEREGGSSIIDLILRIRSRNKTSLLRRIQDTIFHHVHIIRSNTIDHIAATY